MSYAHLTWDPATTSRAATGLFVPAASGEALSSTTSLALTGAAIPVLGAAIWIGFLIMARRSAWPLTGLYLLINMGLLIPTRDTSATSLVLLALGVLLAFSVVRLSRRDRALATGEGIFARITLVLPLLVLPGRSVWLYAPGELFHTTLSLIGYLGLLQALRHLKGDSRWREAVSVFVVGLLAALVGLGDLGIEAVSSFTVGGWTGLVLVGVATVLAGSLIERHGRRFRAAMGNWNRRFQQTD